MASAETERERRILSAIFACGSEDCPRPFALCRDQDVTGVSGTGTVAHGVQFADGTTVLRWMGASPSTVVWGSLDDAMKVHGHDGKTRLVWLAAEFSEMVKAEEEANGHLRAALRLAREALLADGYFTDDQVGDDAPGVGNHEVAVTASGALVCADDWCACGGRGRLLEGKDRLTLRTLSGAVTRHREIHVQRPPETTANCDNRQEG